METYYTTIVSIVFYFSLVVKAQIINVFIQEKFFKISGIGEIFKRTETSKSSQAPFTRKTEICVKANYKSKSFLKNTSICIRNRGKKG